MPYITAIGTPTRCLPEGGDGDANIGAARRRPSCVRSHMQLQMPHHRIGLPLLSDDMPEIAYMAPTIWPLTMISPPAGFNRSTSVLLYICS